MIPTAWVVPGLQLPVKELYPPKDHKAFQQVLIEQICIRYGITVEQFSGRWRPQEVAHARQLFCFIMKKYYGKEVMLKDIGSVINKDHSTVITAIKVYETAYKTDDLIPNKVLDHINGKKFERTKDDLHHFQSILKQCLIEPTISSVSQDV
jgi:hypothetical protein